MPSPFTPRRSPATAGSIYQDPNTIEHEAGPETGEMYAQLDRSKKKKKPKAAPATATTGPVYQDPNAIEHEAGPETGEMYAQLDRSKKKKKPKAAPATATTGAVVYQDPNAIEHEAAPGTGDTYAIPDKPKRGGSRKTQEELDTMYSLPDKSKKKINPELLYADVSVGPPRRHPAPPPKDNEQVLYSTVTHN